MKDILYQKEFVSLVLDDSIPAIYENWRGTASRDEFKEALEHKLALYCQYKTTISDLHWIANLKGLKVNQEAQAWANHDFHQKLYPSGIRKIAFIVPEGTLHLLDNEQLSSHLDIKKQIELCYFDNMAEASEWLQQVSLTQNS